MYFLRVDYVTKEGGPVVRVRSLHETIQKATKAFKAVLLHTDCNLLCRIELCGV